MNKVNFRRLIGAALLFACGTSAFAQNKGFDVTRMDKTADACTDFFQYANGTWLKNTEIPAAYSRWGSFNILGENNNDTLKKVLETAEDKKSAATGSDSQLIGDYYAACMDETKIEKVGIKPLKPSFKRISRIKNTAQLKNQIALMQNAGIPVLFSFYGSSDLKNASQVIANVSQGGLSLPNRDYYTKDDDKSKETRMKFVEYATTMFKLLGDKPDTAAANAKKIMEIQTRLANASKAPVELRDPLSRYNKMTLAQASDITPNFAWADYMKSRGVSPVAEMNVAQPAFFKEMNAMLSDVSLADWKTYLRWSVINSSAGRLSKPFADANFDFYSRYLSGTKEQQPRWRRCVGATDGAVGEALGQEFVKTAFTPEAKARMNTLIDNLFAAFGDRLKNLDWMSDDTKKEGLVKLAAFKRKIGYPDTLRGYKGLKINRQSYLANSLNAAKFESARNLADIGKPLDRTRWGMTPPTVNAYYNSSLNEIVFPAGILQPPFFNFAADDAINYGSIGAVIGHEITHGFDDQGSKFDAMGNFKSWWTDTDRKKFDERASCVADQFSGYEIQPNLNINGRLTLGENIADLGGLTMAYAAYQKSLAGKPHPAAIDGLTPEQRFFLGWAQVWAAKSTPEAERSQVLGDPHSAARFRVNGPLSNLPQFAEAFGCKQPSSMVRQDACLIW